MNGMKGRPPEFQPRRRLQLELPEALYEAIKATARRHGVSAAEAIRRAMQQYVEAAND